MRRSEDNITRNAGFWHTLALINLWVLPLLLLVPNIALDITESTYTWPDRVCNILLPAAAYIALSAAFRRAGIAGLLAIPIMILCAFQIVLLFLYGKSIIAVDMFLNVVTTNVGEATELLRNLSAAIFVVVLLYLPPIIASAFTCAKGIRIGIKNRRPLLSAAAALAVIGIGFAVKALSTETPHTLRHTLFPVNVTANIGEAIHRTRLTSEYFNTSRDFSFHVRQRQTPQKPEIYLLVIGETARADNWQLNGYRRQTNPRLSHRDGLVSFKKALTESNTTHKSVPLLMSHLGSDCFGDSIYMVKGIPETFSEAGFHTAWLSNQKRNGALIDFFGCNSDETVFLSDDGKTHFDMELCARLNDVIDNHKGEKLFVILHTYGSHFNYKERYPEEYNEFTPDNSAEASPSNRTGLVNAYDNSILYTDAVLDSIIGTVERRQACAAMVYLADHGEDIYDDSRERFLHASPTPTYWQLHVPMLVWMSPQFRAEHPDKYAAAVANTGKNVSSSRSAFHTLLSLADIDTPYYDAGASICEAGYQEPSRIYLDDYNEAVALEQSGLENEDLRMLSARHISSR